MRILGIDPGLAHTGYGVIDHDGGRSRLIGSGTIVTPAAESMPRRLQMIYDHLNVVIGKYKPDCAAIEQLFFARNVSTAIIVAQGRGVAILALAERKIELHEYSPLQIKQAITGSGKADKNQITRMVQALLLKTGDMDPALPTTSHAADALAIAMCHAHSYRFKELSDSALALSLARPRRSSRLRRAR